MHFWQNFSLRTILIRKPSASARSDFVRGGKNFHRRSAIVRYRCNYYYTATGPAVVGGSLVSWFSAGYCALRSLIINPWRGAIRGLLSPIALINIYHSANVPRWNASTLYIYSDFYYRFYVCWLYINLPSIYFFLCLTLVRQIAFARIEKVRTVWPKTHGRKRLIRRYYWDKRKSMGAAEERIDIGLGRCGCNSEYRTRENC